MKLHSLIPLFVLGTTLIASAQTPVDPQQPKPKSVASVGKPAPDVAEHKSLRGVSLQPGGIEEVVKQLEGYRSNDLPTVIYAPGANESKIAAPLRFNGDVHTLDALALIAAAAGCALEPISSVPELGENIIGYRIVPVSDRGVSATAVQSGDALKRAGSQEGYVGLTLAQKDGNIVINEVRAGSPAADQKVKPGDQLLAVGEGHQLTGRGEELGKDVDVTSLPLERVSELIRGKPGTVVRLTLRSGSTSGSANKIVSLTRQSLPAHTLFLTPPQVGVFTPSTVVGGHDPALIPNIVPGASGMPGGVPMMPAAQGALPSIPSAKMAAPQVESSGPLVRVYALGSVLIGSEQEMKEKQESVEQLIVEALKGTGVTRKAEPTLSFHTKSRALIVKATVDDHEIIGQVLKAVKENESQQAAPNN